MDHAWYTTAVESLASCHSYDQLRTVVSQSFRQLGLPVWLVAIQVPSSLHAPETYGVNNYDDQWWQEYVDNNWIRHDPIPRYAINNHLPRFWTLDGWADDPAHRWEHDNPDSPEFFRQVERFGARSGLIIPYHLSDHTRCCLNLPHPEPIDRSRPLLMLARIWAFAFMPELIVKVQDIYRLMGVTVPPRLSKREQEVLFWIGEGLTSKAVSGQLGISCRTVESYLSEIQRKLSVSNRQQAIAKAVNLGLLKPAPLLGGLTYSVSSGKATLHSKSC